MRAFAVGLGQIDLFLFLLQSEMAEFKPIMWMLTTAIMQLSNYEKFSHPFTLILHHEYCSIKTLKSTSCL